MKLKNSGKSGEFIKYALIVLAVLGLHLLLIAYFFPEKKSVLTMPGEGPVNIEGKSESPAPPDGPSPEDKDGNDDTEDHNGAPNLVKSSYGVDPYIQKLRRELLPESLTNTGGPPKIDIEMEYIKKALKSDPENRGLLYLAAWNCLMREDYDAFFPYCDGILKKDPENFRGLQIKSNAYYNMGRYSLAIENAKQALQVNPDDGFTRYLLGSSYLLGSNDAKSAIPELTRAIDLNPELPFAYGSLGQSYFEIGGSENIKKGIEVFTRGIEKFPDHQLTFVLMAEDYLYNTGDLERTVELTNRILELNPRSFQAHLMKGCLLMNMGRYSEAEESFRKGAAAGPQYKFQAEIQVCLGQAVYKQGRLDEAGEFFNKAVAIQEKNPETNLYRSDAYVGLSNICLDRGDTAGALRMLDLSVKSYPDNLNQVVARIDWYLATGNPEGAGDYLRTASDHEKNRMYLRKVLVEFLKAKIAMEAGRIDEAEGCLIASIESAPDYLKKLVDRTARNDRHLKSLFKSGEFAGRFESLERNRKKNNTRLK